MSTAAAYKNCPWDPKADSPHQQADFVSEIVSFQQSHILSLSEQLLPIFTILQETDTHLIRLHGLVGEQGSNIQVPLTPQFPA